MPQKNCKKNPTIIYKPFTIISNSDYLWKSDILVGNIVICLNKSILGYNSTEHCSQVVTFFK
jgi:hypothetical protein